MSADVDTGVASCRWFWAQLLIVAIVASVSVRKVR
jgi:hypothetical protein